MTRRPDLRDHFSAILGLLVLAAVACGPPPDVILVTLDTTRADYLGPYNPTVSTPAIDRFATEAVRFHHAWSTASWTLPAHASLFTGTHPTTHGAHYDATRGDATLADVTGGAGERMRVNRLAASAVTLAELLQDAGYATAAFAGGPWLAPPFGLLQGYAMQDFEGAEELSGRLGDELTDRAIAWMRTQPPERRIHLLVNYFDPHWPYEAPAEFEDPTYADRRIVGAHVLAVNRGREELPPDQRELWQARYAAEIRFMDAQIGRLLEALRELERYDDALVILVADHGEAFGEHQLIGHGRSLYDDVLRVPLIVRYPGAAAAGSEVLAPVSIVDILPLIAAEVGLDVPEGVEGVRVGDRSLVLAEAYRDAHAIGSLGPRFDRDLFATIRWPWKLILSHPTPPELYNLRTDPGELENESGVRIGVEIELRTAALEARAGLRPPERPQPPRDVDPATQQRLRELGYVE